MNQYIYYTRNHLEYRRCKPTREGFGRPWHRCKPVDHQDIPKGDWQLTVDGKEWFLVEP